MQNPTLGEINIIMLRQVYFRKPDIHSIFLEGNLFTRNKYSPKIDPATTAKIIIKLTFFKKYAENDNPFKDIKFCETSYGSIQLYPFENLKAPIRE